VLLFGCRLNIPYYVAKSVWVKTRRVFRHKEWHREKKVSGDGWVGSQHAHRFFFYCATPWSIRCVCACCSHVRMCCTLFCFVRYWFITSSCLAGFAAISVILSHVNCIWEWWVGEFRLEDGRRKDGRRKDRGGSGESRVLIDPSADYKDTTLSTSVVPPSCQSLNYGTHTFIR